MTRWTVAYDHDNPAKAVWKCGGENCGALCKADRKEGHDEEFHPRPDWPATVALPGAISHGTVNPEHVAPVFYETLFKINPDRAREIYENMPNLLHFPNDLAGYHEALFEVVTSLIDALDDAAPEGYYFGHLEGDGSDFGFWEVEDELVEFGPDGKPTDPTEDTPGADYEDRDES
jgi:hypothetical protein